MRAWKKNDLAVKKIENYYECGQAVVVGGGLGSEWQNDRICNDGCVCGMYFHAVNMADVQTVYWESIGLYFVCFGRARYRILDGSGSGWGSRGSRGFS